MDKITEALGLKPDASTDDIVAAIAALNAQVADLKTARTGIPKGIDASKVTARVSAGLTKEQAIECEQRQIEADKAAEKAEAEAEKAAAKAAKKAQ